MNFEINEHTYNLVSKAGDTINAYLDKHHSSPLTFAFEYRMAVQLEDNTCVGLLEVYLNGDTLSEAVTPFLQTVSPRLSTAGIEITAITVMSTKAHGYEDWKDEE